MNRGLYTIASGGVAAQARLDAAAQNLANLNTTGYKAERPIFRVRPLMADPSAALDPLSRTAAQVTEVQVSRDFSPGPVHTTGNALDVAIEGDGFFAVSTPQGERYTRQGSFTRDGNGYLVTQHGERVQGEGGDVRLTGGAVVIGGDGTISVDGVPSGRLKLVDFGEHPGLVPEGNALFAPVSGAVPAALGADQVRVQQGALEASNVDAVRGMIELIDVARGYESYMHALRRLDDVTERSISDVGRF